jgi:hypothetical protein
MIFAFEQADGTIGREYGGSLNLITKHLVKFMEEKSTKYLRNWVSFSFDRFLMDR